MLNGSCLCGGVRYEATGPLRLMARCHCVQCRKASGAEFATNGSVDAASFRVVAGSELLSNYESSPGQARYFCSRCGSPLFKRGAARPEDVRLRLGCVDSELEQTPALHVFVSEKPSWSEISDSTPQFATLPDANAARPNGEVRADAAQRSQFTRRGYRAVTPRVVARDASRLVAFVQLVFGAKGKYLDALPSEIRIGDCLIMISEAGVRDPVQAFLYVYVQDTDETYRRALAAGARSLEQPTDMPYGDRRCMVQDEWGNTWQIATYHRA